MKHTAMMAVLLSAILSLSAVHAAAQTVTVDPNALFCFSPEDFTALSEDEGIYITAVPSAAIATVCYGNRVLRPGDALPKEALSQLTLHTACSTAQSTSIRYFTISNGSAAAAKELKLSIMPAKNEPPVAEDSSLQTYKNIANTGSLKASDPEGKALTYTVIQQPKRGVLELYEDGTFTYTPNKNKVGKDSFTFTVTDSAGNTSEPAKVSIEILKPTDKAAYADMAGDPDAFYAMWMKDNGLYTGSTVGGFLCFKPNETVNRGDFLVMVMNLIGADADASEMSSGFSDEGVTPVWMRPYIVSALGSGMINGTVSENGVVFRPSDPLTGSEAAVMLQNILQLPNVDTAPVFADSDNTVPAWAEQAAAAVSAAGIPVNSASDDHIITNADAARILYCIHVLMENASLPTFYWMQ